jgi:uncharacterized protein with GYD domain
MILGKYSDQGVTAAMEEGFATREEALRPAVEALGGQLEAMYFCPAYSGFDFVIVLTAPDAELVNAMTLIGSTNPAFADGGKMIELKTGGEADASVAAAKDAMARYRPPGG